MTPQPGCDKMEMDGYTRLAIAVLSRAIDDLSLPAYRQDALSFLHGPVALFWGSVAGVSAATLARKVHSCLARH